MKLPNAIDYYEERDTSHVAQGDIFADLPFSIMTVAPEGFTSSGARKRGSGPSDEIVALRNGVGPSVLLHYTCGFTAQPPGTEGYSHEYRLVAPIFSVRTLKADFGMKNNELRKIIAGYAIQGFMYLPQSERLVLGEPEVDDEWTGHAAALLYRPSVVSQAVLDGRDRLHEMTEPAIKILNASMINVYSPNDFDPETLASPDLTDSWDS